MNDNLRQIYNILYDYFQDASILNDMKEFRKWLERIKWYIKKCDEYARKFEEIKNPCEDCISREETESKLREYADTKCANGQIELANGILNAVCFLRNQENIPSVQPARLKGKQFDVDETLRKINKYHADCDLSESDEVCKVCANNIFESIKRIIKEACK